MKTFVLNYKNYLEGAGNNTLDISKTASEIANKYKIDMILAPPQPSLSMVAQNVDLPVIAQHLDNVETGSTTGFFVTEIAKSYGLKGSLINHSEHRINKEEISDLVLKLKSNNMFSIVCAKDLEEVTKVANFFPDFIAIEPPELIGSGRSVSKENPDIITNSIINAKRVSKSIKVLCGAGITNFEDVRKAIQLGVDGILVASGVIKSKNWYESLNDLAKGFAS